MAKSEYTATELLDILKKVNLDGYRHVVWMIRECLKMNGRPRLRSFDGDTNKKQGE